MVGLDFHRKLSKMSNPSLNRPINPGRQVNLGLFFHLSTTHVPAETYIYDSDAKAETKDCFILDGSTYCYWYRNSMTRFYLMTYSNHLK